MNDLNKKTALDSKQIDQIHYILTQKANNWVLSGGSFCDGIEVYRTQNEEIFVIKDVETGIEIGMRKEVRNEGVLTHLSFFSFKDMNNEDNEDKEDQTDNEDHTD